MAYRERVVLAAAVVPLLLLVSPTARAECPDGWFCDDGQPSTPAAEPGEPPPPPLDTQPPGSTPPPSGAEPRSVHPAHISVEQPPEPPRPPRRKRRELGVNLHFDVGLLGADAAEGAAMVGVGAAFRIRPQPAFAVDLGLEFAGGEDFQENRRFERAFVANALVFFNPRDPVQLYALGGFGVGTAWVDVRHLGGVPVPAHEEEYSYAGVQGGLGVEFRVARRTALGVDGLVFVRGRTDRGRHSEPEFVEPGTGRATNASGFGLLRAGVTFYF